MPHLSFRTVRTLFVAAACAGVAAGGASAADAKTSHPKASASAKAKAKTKSAKPKGQTDLIAGALAVDFLDATFTVSATISNTGSRRSRKSEVSVALSSDTVLDDEDEVLEDVPLPRVQPHAQRTVSTELDIPEELPAGNVYLLVCADGNAAVKETREDNNCVSELISSDTADDLDLGTLDAGGDDDDAPAEGDA